MRQCPHALLPRCPAASEPDEREVEELEREERALEGEEDISNLVLVRAFLPGCKHRRASHAYLSRCQARYCAFIPDEPPLVWGVAHRQTAAAVGMGGSLQGGSWLGGRVQERSGPFTPGGACALQDEDVMEVGAGSGHRHG